MLDTVKLALVLARTVVIAVDTNCVVATCVVLVPSVAVGASGMPVNTGLSILLLSASVELTVVKLLA